MLWAVIECYRQLWFTNIHSDFSWPHCIANTSWDPEKNHWSRLRFQTETEVHYLQHTHTHIIIYIYICVCVCMCVIQKHMHLFTHMILSQICPRSTTKPSWKSSILLVPGCFWQLWQLSTKVQGMQPAVKPWIWPIYGSIWQPGEI